jgi:hypothetical protein
MPAGIRGVATRLSLSVRLPCVFARGMTRGRASAREANMTGVGRATERSFQPPSVCVGQRVAWELFVLEARNGFGPSAARAAAYTVSLRVSVQR